MKMESVEDQQVEVAAVGAPQKACESYFLLTVRKFQMDQKCKREGEGEGEGEGKWEGQGQGEGEGEGEAYAENFVHCQAAVTVAALEPYTQ